MQREVADRREAPESEVAGPLRPLVAAVAAAALLALTGLLALDSAAVRSADISARTAFEGLGERQHVDALAHAVAKLAEPLPVAAVTLLLVVVAVARGRPRTALGVGMVVLGANLTTQVLKPGLARPRVTELLGADLVPTASWPSGHSTGAMTLALCAVLVAAPRWRPVVATAGAVFAVAVGYSLLVLGAHFPSDVLGGYLVAAVWALTVAAALRAADARWPARTGRGAVLRLEEALTVPLVVAVAALGAGTLAFLVRPDVVLAGGARHTTAVLAGLAVGGLGLSVATAVVLALRR
jgi:membrane-associated phospholipid phosphatase